MMNPDVHERLELTLSHVHKVETNSALSVALRQFREYLERTDNIIIIWISMFAVPQGLSTHEASMSSTSFI